jgi:hypothetical protein
MNLILKLEESMVQFLERKISVHIRFADLGLSKGPE